LSTGLWLSNKHILNFVFTFLSTFFPDMPPPLPFLGEGIFSQQSFKWLNLPAGESYSHARYLSGLSKQAGLKLHLQLEGGREPSNDRVAFTDEADVFEV
jgi:hypothetical protein